MARTTLNSHRAFLTFLTILVACFAATASASAAAVKLVAPAKVEAPEAVPYAVSAPAGAARVAFFVDCRRRWVSHSRKGSVDRSGRLPSGEFASGSHSLTVKVLRRGEIRVTSRKLYVSRRKKVKPAPEPAPAPAPAPEEPTPAPEEPAPAPAPAPAPEEPAPAPEEPEPAPAPAPEEPAPAPEPILSTLFNSGFDGSFSGWYVQSLPGRASIVGGSSFQGRSNARFEVREGDVEPDTGSNRSEVSGPTYSEGQDLYIRDAIRIPSANTFKGSWQIIQQLHETNWGGSPGIALFLSENRNLQLGAGDGSPTYWKSAQLRPDTWYELIYRVNLSQSSTTGFVEVWLNGSPQTLLNGKTRSYGQTMQTNKVYLKAGIYRGKASTGTSLIEHDAITVGSSLAAVSGR